MERTEKYFPCECGGEVLMIDKYTYDDFGIEDEFYFSIFRYGNWMPSLKWRLKWAWKILIKGELYSDQIILSKKSVVDIRDYLNNNL